MIKCIIVDDEPLAIELLESHLKKVDGFQLVGTAQNAIDAHRILQQQHVDLMFLDIQMPDLSGIELMKLLDKKPKVIFTTAYREFAVEGFELEAVDYILKPITFERFFKAINKLKREVGNDFENSIMIKSEGVNRKIKVDDIIFIESQGNDLKLCVNGAFYFVKNTITEFTERLSKSGFVRIHRSFIFNPFYVTGYNNAEILLGNYAVPIGKNYKQAFNDFVVSYSKTL
ncbi:LytR/AlgR family response regulator transcription factor [Mucilaginibacter sp. KACC 22063]|uniref:LytR/AlgR family response regulator transcription factor n=1 Tax=Mucilaginibacter sp. KACC 22063 TaxID=3025666 RepID=UPI002366ADDD|nr:LytTR family DNA-binding domain-containing protein [Mucilaginibacter sp. KACC 22063]WDF57331.1 LytTR family DNA-binding domain-containing protein [Mucilaginibacter sp. KACC 22063]